MTIDTNERLEENAVSSAKSIINSIQAQIGYGNYNAAMSALGSLTIFLVEAETNRRMVELIKLQEQFESGGVK